MWRDRDFSLVLARYKDVQPHTLRCVLGLFDRTRMRLESHWGDAFRSRTKNLLVTRAWKAGAEWYLLLEDGIVFPNGKKDWAKYTCIKNSTKYDCNLADRLVSHGKMLVSPNSGQVKFGNTLIEEGKSSDCGLLFHKSVLDAIVENNRDQKDFLEHNDHDGIRFFTFDSKEKSTDNPYEAFIRKAKKAGISLFIDAGARIFKQEKSYG